MTQAIVRAGVDYTWSAAQVALYRGFDPVIDGVPHRMWMECTSPGVFEVEFRPTSAPRETWGEVFTLVGRWLERHPCPAPEIDVDLEIQRLLPKSFPVRRALRGRVSERRGRRRRRAP